MKAYLISGLGADERVFQFLKLPEGVEPVCLKWIKPEPHESLESYAARLAEKIDDKEPYVLIGLSLGGMLAIEISKKKKPEATILISSAATCTEIPKFYRMAGSVGLHKIIPTGIFKTGSFLKRYFISESPECKRVVRELIKDVDPEFVRWGMDAIIHWNNTQVPERVYRIHGNKDEILPLHFKPTYEIPEGRHMMVLDKAGEISTCLAKICAETLSLDNTSQ